MRKLIYLFIVLFLAIGLLTTDSYAYKVQKLRVVSLTGNLLWAPERYAAEFNQRTGIEIETVGFSYSSLYERLMRSFESGSHEFDIIIYATNWSANIMDPGYVKEVPESIKAKIDWEDVLPLFRERILTWEGKVYGIPYDGDIMMVYYRKDLLNNPEYKRRFRKRYGYKLRPPQTWEEYRDIAEFFAGWDWNGDGIDDYGVAECMRPKGQSYWNFIARAASYFKLPGDPDIYFDSDTMKPLINNPGYVKALEDYLEIVKFGPPNIRDLTIQDVRPIFLAGNVALSIDWGDTGTNTYAPESKIKGKVGAIKHPGTKKVWNRKTQRWENYPKINFAPFNSFGGWIASVTSTCPDPDAAFEFLALMLNKENSLKNVTFPGTPCNPYRYSHFEDIDAWVASGFDYDSAKSYLGAIRDGLDHPNLGMDLRIPGAEDYFQTLDLYLGKAIYGEMSPQEALDNVAEKWEVITNRLGREKQKRLYRASLSL